MTPRIPILMYHQIDAPPPRGTPMRSLVVAARDFSWQMRLLRLMGYRGLALRDLLPYLRGEKAGKVVGITLDDGYRNNLEHALPVLQRCGFSATCYAVSSLVGRTNAWDTAIGVPQTPLMTVPELRTWTRAGMEVGAHTRTHVDLTRMDGDAARDQIAGSKLALQDALGVPVRHFCYPYGAFNQPVADLVREAGYHSAVTTQRGRAAIGGNLFGLPRVLVARSSHAGHVLLKLATAYEDRRGAEVVS
ncbi:polysaccharide deacetylase family protein [Cupriavidus basilensis]|uniref:Polysaccharide deacetylase n=1 Tax=Cupriavidus basilensis TaxID=68895 RepID=A0A0C4YJF0_9BURK|nr:polysaccharide deacetylase family protein [Cupriavidus basilensis]AJG22745.1 Polysaccharide deacetylase [Cupriavidus basilensis]